jgi:hypothetical protein
MSSQSRRASARRRAAAFALWVLPLLAACTAAYLVVLPGWQSAVVRSTDMVLHHLSPPMRLTVNEAGYWNAFRLDPGGGETFFWGRPPENLHLFFIGLAILPALVLATPVRLLDRARLALIGLALLFVCQVLAAVALTHAQYHLRMLDAESVFWDYVKTIANAFGQLISIVLWVVLTWHAWLREPSPPE